MKIVICATVITKMRCDIILCNTVNNNGMGRLLQ